MSDDPLSLAKRLIAAGVPCVIVRPGDKPPEGWQSARADLKLLNGFRPGVDAVAMVSGGRIDVFDVDMKEGKNGDINNLVPGGPRKTYGVTQTPGGGYHLPQPQSLVGKVSPLVGPGGFVGDYCGGRIDGTGRLLVFLPGSTRSKYPDGGYVELVEWDIEGLLNDEADPAMVDALLSAGGTYDAPVVYTDNSPERPSEDGHHPYAEGGVARELARLTACETLGWDGEPWDITTYAVACNLVEIGNSRWTGYTLEELHSLFLSAAPSDEGFGRQKHEEKWAGAVDKVNGGGRKAPDGEDIPFTVYTEGHKIFDATPVLQHIRTAAHAKLVGSGALLLYVLGRVLAEAPPDIVLPAVIGSEASLNLGVALVGRSGDGKSSTAKVAAQVLGVEQQEMEIGAGSGEGLMESYLEMVSKPHPKDATKTIQVKQMIDPPNRILEVDEIGHLGAVGKREGATLMAVLRTALTGGAMKISNATQERTRRINGGIYRLITFVGVQPELSDILLNDSAAGTPQRFVWVSTVDRTVQRVRPEWPGSLDWDPLFLELAGRHVVTYPDHIVELIVETKYQQTINGTEALAGHLLLTRLKVAVAVAMLHGEIDITDQWWLLSGHIMEWSKKEQDRCREVLNEVSSRATSARGVTVAREKIAEENEHLRVVESAILRALGRGLSGWTEVRNSIRANHRPLAEDALTSLLEHKKVIVKESVVNGAKARHLSLP